MLADRIDQAKETRELTRRLDRAITELARMATKSAGLDPTLLGIHPHNASVARHYGKPWSGVDYAMVDLAQFLIRLSWLPGRLDAMLWELRELGTENDPLVPDSYKMHILRKMQNGEWPWRIPTSD